MWRCAKSGYPKALNIRSPRGDKRFRYHQWSQGLPNRATLSLQWLCRASTADEGNCHSFCGWWLCITCKLQWQQKPWFVMFCHLFLYSKILRNIRRLQLFCILFYAFVRASLDQTIMMKCIICECWKHATFVSRVNLWTSLTVEVEVLTPMAPAQSVPIDPAQDRRGLDCKHAVNLKPRQHNELPWNIITYNEQWTKTGRVKHFQSWQSHCMVPFALMLMHWRSSRMSLKWLSTRAWRHLTNATEKWSLKLWQLKSPPRCDFNIGQRQRINDKWHEPWKMLGMERPEIFGDQYFNMSDHS